MGIMIPMISPTGALGEIPQERVNEAVQSGFKLGVNMLSPSGKSGVIPRDNLVHALSAGFKVQNNEPTGPTGDSPSALDYQGMGGPVMGVAVKAIPQLASDIKEQITPAEWNPREAQFGVLEGALAPQGSPQRVALETARTVFNAPQRGVAGTAEDLAGQMVPFPVKKMAEQVGAGKYVEAVTTGGLAAAELAAAGQFAKPKVQAAMNRVVSERIAPKPANILRESAASNLEQVLGATKERLKAAASEHVVPGMVERGVVGMSRKSLLAKANAEVARHGAEVGRQIEIAQQSGKRVPTAPLIEAIEKVREQHQVRNEAGVVTTERTPALDMLDGIQETLRLYGDSMSPKELQGLRKFWDKDVADSTKGFLLDQPQAALDVKRDTTNLLRGKLNDEFRNVGASNKEFSFWKDMQTVLEATQLRTNAQSGVVGKFMRRGTGAGVGGTIGGVVAGPGGAAFGAGVGAVLAELMQTTAWRTVSAATKVKIANAITAGSPKLAVSIAERAVGFEKARQGQSATAEIARPAISRPAMPSEPLPVAAKPSAANVGPNVGRVGARPAAPKASVEPPPTEATAAKSMPKPAQLMIKPTLYKGKRGFSVVGKDGAGRAVKIFLETRDEAKGVKADIEAGKDMGEAK